MVDVTGWFTISTLTSHSDQVEVCTGIDLVRVFTFVGLTWSWCGALYRLTGFGPLCLTLSVFQGGGAVR